MSSEPPRLDIIASGDQREGGREEGGRESLFYSSPLKMSVVNCLLSISRTPRLFLYVRVTIIRLMCTVGDKDMLAKIKDYNKKSHVIMQNYNDES